MGRSSAFGFVLIIFLALIQLLIIYLFVDLFCQVSTYGDGGPLL
jgi:hypothetical protein